VGSGVRLVAAPRDPVVAGSGTIGGANGGGGRKGGGAGLGCVGRVVRWAGGCDGEVVCIRGDGERGRGWCATIDAIEFVGGESVTGRRWRENEVLVVGWCGV
jgi:hypothetical protein